VPRSSERSPGSCPGSGEPPRRPRLPEACVRTSHPRRAADRTRRSRSASGAVPTGDAQTAATPGAPAGRPREAGTGRSTRATSRARSRSPTRTRRRTASWPSRRASGRGAPGTRAGFPPGVRCARRRRPGCRPSCRRRARSAPPGRPLRGRFRQASAHRERVLERGGEAVLGRQPTAECHDQAAARYSQLAKWRVITLGADHESTAVQVQDGLQPTGSWEVDARGHRTGRAGQLDVLDGVQAFRRGLQIEHHEVFLSNRRGQSGVLREHRAPRPSARAASAPADQPASWAESGVGGARHHVTGASARRRRTP
jgi:hypothetical protein